MQLLFRILKDLIAGTKRLSDECCHIVLIPRNNKCQGGEEWKRLKSRSHGMASFALWQRPIPTSNFVSLSDVRYYYNPIFVGKILCRTFYALCMVTFGQSFHLRCHLIHLNFGLLGKGYDTHFSTGTPKQSVGRWFQPFRQCSNHQGSSGS